MLFLLWLSFILFFLALYIGAVKGYTINFFYAACGIMDALKNVVCQLWLDVRKLFGKKIELDEHEQHLS